jgi:hypothetical protein
VAQQTDRDRQEDPTNAHIGKRTQEFPEVGSTEGSIQEDTGKKKTEDGSDEDL